MAGLSEHEILWNVAALSALRRPQLVSLSKKYGLRANGKNQEMVQRLHEFGQTLTPASKTAFDYGVNSRVAKFSKSPSVKMPEPEMSDDDNDEAPSVVPTPDRLKPKTSNGTLKEGRESDAWEVLTSGDSSLINDNDRVDATEKNSHQLPWKSASNGRPLGDVESKHQRSDSKSGSLKSLGSSLRRAASRSLSISRRNKEKDALAASTSTSANATNSSNNSIKPPTILSPVRGETPEGDDAVTRLDGDDDEPMHEDDDDDDDPPSPASAIGVVKRHSSMTLQHRPSTIRLVSPGPSALPEITRAVSPEPNKDDDDELPLTGLNSVDAIKKRRSVQFLNGLPSSRAAQHQLNRRSMPVLMSPHAITPAGSRIASAPSASLYPDLSKIDASPAKLATKRSPSPNLPGSFPDAAVKPASPTSPSFVFGTGDGTSSAAFSDAGMKLLQEMQTKMGGTAFNPELLKGKRAEVNKLVSTNTNLGSGPTGGWGLSAPPALGANRFAKAHDREFSKMQSINSVSTVKTNSASSLRPAATPGTKRKLEESTTTTTTGSLPQLVNGLPAPRASISQSSATQDKKDEEEDGRKNKRTKVVTAPRYLSSMTSLRGAVSKISGSVGPGTPTSRARSNLRSEARNRFPFLGHKKTNSDAKSVADSVTSDDYVLAKGPSEKAAPQLPKRVSSLVGSTATSMRTPAATTAACATSRAISSGPGVAARRVASASSAASASTGPPVTMVPMKDHSGAQAKRSLPPPRTKAASTSSLARSTATASTASTSSLASQPRKASGSSLASSRGSATTTSSLRHSTLLSPTASSLARMQSTVKPPVLDASHGVSTPKRPLPQPPTNAATGVSIAGIAPQIPTMSPFGAASSRTNYLFESNFHFPQPDAKSPAVSSPSKRPLPQPPSGIRPPSVLSPGRAVFSPGNSALSPSGIPRPRMNTPLRVGKSPARPTVSSAQRARNRESGVASIKARGDSTVGQRRQEIRARHERMKQERELRAMLG